jgi:hypothetical protein
MSVRLPELGALATARLWLSYQRYAVALVGVPVAAFALAAASARWWAAAVVALAAVVPVRFGIEVLGRWPRKLRATRIAIARIQAGTFAPASVRGYCDDPCFRVVAREILARAGMSRGERRALVRDFSDQRRREGSVAIIIDHVRGTITTVGGDAQERT